jgi:hypothetical protein
LKKKISGQISQIWAWHQDILTDWPSVAMWLWLWPTSLLLTQLPVVSCNTVSSIKCCTKSKWTIINVGGVSHIDTSPHRLFGGPPGRSEQYGKIEILDPTSTVTILTTLHRLIKKNNILFVYLTFSVVYWSEFLATESEVRVRFSALPYILRSSVSRTGSTQSREYSWGAIWKKNSSSGLENREFGRSDPSRWPPDTLYPQKLALTSPASGGRSVGIVLSRTRATEFIFLLVLYVYLVLAPDPEGQLRSIH